MSKPDKPDFAALAREAQNQHEDRTAAEAAKRASERAESDRLFAAAVAALEREVLPLLTDAESVFREMGIPSLIVPNWGGVGRPMRPQLSFQCEGPTIINMHGGRTTPKSIKAFFSHDGQVLRVGLSKHSHAGSPDGSREVGADVSGAVEKAVKAVLDSYYQSKEAGPH